MKQVQRASFLASIGGACMICICAQESMYDLPVLPPPPTPLHYTPEKYTPEKEDPVLVPDPEAQRVGPLTDKSPEDALRLLAPFLMSRSVEKAVEQFTNLSADEALAILELLVENDKAHFEKKGTGRPFEVKRNDVLQIIFGVASQYQDTKTRYRFFDLIDRYEGLKLGIRPLLFVLSISSYPVLIPEFITWLRDHGDTDTVSVAALYAVDRISGRSLKALHMYTASDFTPLLGQLLWHAVSSRKEIKIITQLLNLGADVHYKDTSGYTPLIKAVELGNLAVTKLLIENGADIDLVVKDDIGSAWQKASEIGNPNLIKYMSDRYKRTIPGAL